MPSELTQLSLREAAELVRTKQVSPVVLTLACLERIETMNPRLNAFITVMAERALEQARAAEEEIQAGNWRGPLHGIPIALKDLIDTAGVRTTAASAVFQDRVPTEDAEVVRRLKTAGAVLIGKTNLHEFAYGASSVVSHFGPTKNPWKEAYITGGSSGGSAAAVASGMCYGAIGTDTACSIRQPAAYCGIVGLKPTYGRVSARGVIPLCWSLDHVGPMTCNAGDAAVMLQAIAGHDPHDPASSGMPVPDYPAALNSETSALQVGIPRQHFYAEVDPELAAKIEDALKVLSGITAGAVEVAVPVNTDRTLAMAETYAYHAEMVARSPELYQPETLRRIQGGANVSARDYIRARRELDLLRQAARGLFREVDVLVTPTTPVPPPTIAELLADPAQLRNREIEMLRNCRPFNVLGLPAISVRCGFTRQGLPIGMQIVGPWGREDVVLKLARAYEEASGAVSSGNTAARKN